MSKLLTLVCLLIALGHTSFAIADEVLIFHNANSKSRVSRHDEVVVEQNSLGLRQVIENIDPDLKVRLVPVSRPDEIALELGNVKDKVRGIIFVGHGNPRIYALNSQIQISPEDLARKIAYHLRPSDIASRLSIYFLACNMATQEKGSRSYQDRFYSKLTNILPQVYRDKLDVTAHIAMTGPRSYETPNWFHKFSYRSGVGRIAERFALKMIIPYTPWFWIGGTYLYASMLEASTPTSAKAATATALGLMLVRLFEGGMTRYGIRATESTRREAPVSELLEESFTVSRCHRVFR